MRILTKKREANQVTPSKLFNLEAKYDGAIFYADKQIGKLIDKLKSTGELENTIIAIGSDHGIELLEHGTSTHGYCPYEEVVKVPLVIYSEKDFEGSRVIKSQGRIFDIGPTLLGLVDIDPPKIWEGIDLLAKEVVLPEIAFTWGYGVYSVRTPRYKMVYQNIKNAPEIEGNYWKEPVYEL